MSRVLSVTPSVSPSEEAQVLALLARYFKSYADNINTKLRACIGTSLPKDWNARATAAQLEKTPGDLNWDALHTAYNLAGINALAVVAGHEFETPDQEIEAVKKNPKLSRCVDVLNHVLYNHPSRR